MRGLTSRGFLAACLLTGALVLTGCTNPDAPNSTPHTTPATSPENQGEQTIPLPPSPAAQSPADVESTAPSALQAFSHLYSNWTYKTLSADQRTLAAMSVGAARLSEQRAAAASAADTTIARGHIWNSSQIVSVSTDLAKPGTWVIVTSEQTGGSSAYQGLPTAYHVTFAHLARVPGGFAVSEWLPQS